MDCGIGLYRHQVGLEFFLLITWSLHVVEAWSSHNVKVKHQILPHSWWLNHLLHCIYFGRMSFNQFSTFSRDGPHDNTIKAQETLQTQQNWILNQMQKMHNSEQMDSSPLIQNLVTPHLSVAISSHIQCSKLEEIFGEKKQSWIQKPWMLSIAFNSLMKMEMDETGQTSTNQEKEH